MDFSEAVKAETKEERDALIEAEAARENWLDYLGDEMVYGGYPADAQVDDVVVEDDGDRLLVTVGVDFDEARETGCDRITHTWPGFAKIQITIDRETGEYEVIGQEVEIDDGEEERDFFPADYL